MGIDIRRIRPGEGALLRVVRLRALADAPNAFTSSLEAEAGRPDAQWEDAATKRSGGDREATFVAVDGNEAVGLAGGYHPRLDAALVEVVSMWVAPLHRRSGVAGSLLQAVVGWADEAGAAEVELWVTRGNDAALRTYQRDGFVVTGDVQPLPSDPCQDELRMRRTCRASA